MLCKELEEEILHSILLSTPRWAAGATDGEIQTQFGMFFHQPLHNGALTATAGSTHDYHLALFHLQYPLLL